MARSAVLDHIRQTNSDLDRINAYVRESQERQAQQAVKIGTLRQLIGRLEQSVQLIADGAECGMVECTLQSPRCPAKNALAVLAEVRQEKREMRL